MATPPVPPALRSRLQLLRTTSLAAGTSSGAAPLTPYGTTYTMAQEATWIDDRHFAVGRWDGSLEIFEFTESTAQGPLIDCSVNSPAQEGVQMITPLDATSFASSNGDGSIAIWTTTSSNIWSDARARAVLDYDPTLGAANSGAAIRDTGGNRYFVAGHANGSLTIWRNIDQPPGWSLVKSVDIRAKTPVNPWGMHNIRGIDVVRWTSSTGMVVAGSEDGNLTLVEIPSGTIVNKVCYNAAAQRGINSLAVDGTTLLVANCAVGSTDRNLWAYTIDASGQIRLVDSANLAADLTAPQIFNFDVVWGTLANGQRAFFSTTEEGILWTGTTGADGKLSIVGSTPVTRSVGSSQVLHLGSAVCFSRGRVAVANYDISEFMVAPS